MESGNDLPASQDAESDEADRKHRYFLDLIEKPHEVKFSNPAKAALNAEIWSPGSRGKGKPTFHAMLHLKPDGRVVGMPLQPARARLHRLQAEEPELFELAPFAFVQAKIESDGSLVLPAQARKHLGLLSGQEKEPQLWLHVRPGYFELLPDAVHTEQGAKAHRELGRISLNSD